jgi:oxalate decarboxylase
MSIPQNPSAAPSSKPELAGLDRRKFIGAGSSALLLSALAISRATGQDIQKVMEAQQNKSMTDPGPENGSLKDISQNGFLPPPTDQGEAPEFWNSFAIAHRRVQPGGWTRQIAVEDFPISKDIAGVNMRLTAGGIRELHWHEAAEWGLTLSGKARLTALDYEGKAYVKDVQKDDIWFFPPGVPHSIQGLEGDGVEFLLVFDNGNFSEGNTTLITDWLRHCPPEVLAKNWGVTEKDLEQLYTVPAEGLFIFQKGVPGSLEDEQKQAAGSKGLTQQAFDFPMHSMAPTFKTKSGEVRIVDSKNFPVTTTAMAHVTVKPGGLRELHWHPNANEWSYFLKGKGRMTVFFTAGKARTMDFNAGDVGYVPQTFGHYVENTGDTDLVFIEMFKSPHFIDLSLSDWVSHAPQQLITDHLRITPEVLSAIPKADSTVVPV